ncbi:ribose-5-phosphate isomerase RpiA [Ignavibacteria bacterium]|nr:ribose-5-phosphate isomerase RpiA [Bacteroidota bacterium]MCZ2132449.1 ribose-5-phosphate isomerase RpiA [Bacteroidota bacterium]
MNKSEELKRLAAVAAVEEIKSGMTLGLGTGSTANYAIEEIGKRIAAGMLSDIHGIPSSVRTENLARAVGIPLLTFDDCQTLDLTIDGADEIDPLLRLIKGGGGALLREKVLAQASARFIVIADESKISDALGEKWALPVEVVPFAWKAEVRFIETLGAKTKLRVSAGGPPILTDQRNFLLDCDFGRMNNPDEIAARLSSRAGIVEHGLFIGLASQAIIAGTDGIRRIEAKV